MGLEEKIKQRGLLSLGFDPLPSMMLAATLVTGVGAGYAYSVGTPEATEAGHIGVFLTCVYSPLALKFVLEARRRYNSNS